MSNDKPRIGFIGLGLMGHGMAKNIVAKGFPLTIRVHRNRKPAEDILAAGAKEARTNAELARASDVVILCVTGSPQIEEIVYGEEGILGAARAGLTVIDTSTAEPASTAKIRADFARKGVTYVDAPLARTPKEAEEGRLNTMVGADDATFARLKPVFSAYCENVVHAGPPGHGHMLKLVNNFIGMAIATAVAEACAACAKSGVSIKKLHELVSAGALNSGIFQLIVGKMLEGGDLYRAQVHAGQRDEGPSLLHALRRVAADARDRRRSGAPEPRQRQPARLRRQVRRLALEAQEKLAGVKIVPR